MDYIKDYRFLPGNARERLSPKLYYYLIAYEDGYNRSKSDYVRPYSAIRDSQYHRLTGGADFPYIFNELASLGFLSTKQDTGWTRYKPTGLGKKLNVIQVGDISEYKQIKETSKASLRDNEEPTTD